MTVTGTTIRKWAFHRTTMRQWIGAGAIGLVLGIYILYATQLSNRWMYLMLMAALCPFVAMIVGSLRRVLLAAIALDIPLQISTTLSYRSDAADLGAFYGYNISLTTLALIGLYVLWLSDLLGVRESRAHTWLRAAVPLTLYALITIASYIIATDKELALFGIFLLLQIFLLYVYIIATVRTREHIIDIIAMLLAGLAIEGVLMIILRLTGKTISFGSLAGRVDTPSSSTEAFSRLGGTIGSPNNAGAYLSLLMPPALAVWLSSLDMRYKWLAAVGFGLGALGLLFTLSRGAWTAVGIAIMIIFFFAWQRGWLPITVPLAFGLVLIPLVIVFQDALITRLLPESGTDITAGRIVLLQLAQRIIQDHPMFGVGANNYVVALKSYLTSEFSGYWIYTVHDKYLLIWAETGIFGLGAFILFLLTTLWQGWQSWQLQDRVLSPLALGLSAAIIGHSTQMFVDVFNGRPVQQLLWLDAALITAILIIGRTEKRAQVATSLHHQPYQT